MSYIKSSYQDVHIPQTDLYSLLFNNRCIPNNTTALVDAKNEINLSYKELKERVDRISAGLFANWALKTGDVVAIYANNSIDFVLAVYALVRLGVTVTTVNINYTAKDLTYQLKDSSAVALLTIPSALDIALESTSRLGIPHSRIALISPDSIPATRKIPHISTFQTTTPPPPLPLILPKTTPVFLCYSSGTTGPSKGVILTHHNIVSNILQNASAKSADYDLCKTWIAVLPFYHVYGLVTIMAVTLYMRATLVVVDKFKLESFLRYVEKYHIEGLQVAPPIVVQMLNNPISKQYDLTSIKMIHSAAAPLSAELQDAVKTKLNLPIKQGFGMTETSPSTHSNPTYKIKTGSIGLLYPNMESKIIDPETGLTVPLGERGEMCLRGPNVMYGYLNNPEATRKTIDEDGWLHTGDIAVLDEEGYFFIVDRLKELIKYKGFQVPPAELEGVLLSHPDVVDAAVVPRVDEQAGEVPVAFVVLKDGTGTDGERVKRWMDERVAWYKRLRSARVVEQIPKSASGKILRRVLREVDAVECRKEASMGKVRARL